MFIKYYIIIKCVNVGIQVSTNKMIIVIIIKISLGKLSNKGIFKYFVLCGYVTYLIYIVLFYPYYYVTAWATFIAKILNRNNMCKASYLDMEDKVREEQ